MHVAADFTSISGYVDKMNRQSRIFSAGLSLLPVGVAVAGLSAIETFRQFDLYLSVSGVALSVISLFMVVVPIFLPEQEKEKVMSKDNSIKIGDINGNNNHVGHTYNGPLQRSLTAEIRKDMIEKLPRDKPITLVALMGDNESFVFAEEIQGFLKQQGFNVQEDKFAIAQFTRPIKGLLARETDVSGAIEIIVGSQ